MAFSAHKDSEQVREFESDDTTLERQAAELANLIRQSHHFIAFTGAGVSTSAGIPDFRGPQGVWTLRAKGEFPKSRQSTLSAVPTTGHMALIGLERAGLLKFLISQNTDGLHRRSGFPPEKLAELHGNSNLERCRHCKKEYLRDFSTRSAPGVHDHQTSRKCAVCGHWLHDTIINFSESLPEKPLKDGFINARRADLCLVLGSSLTVSPANQMPQEIAESGGKLVVCNLQKTPLDSITTLRIFSKTDALMEKVMRHLNVPIPEWVLRRWIKISLNECSFEETRSGTTFGYALKLIGVEPDGTPASVLRRVELLSTGESSDKEPFTFRMKDKLEKIPLRLRFMGNYNEPPLKLDVHFGPQRKPEQTYRLEFRLSRPDWEYFEES